jgi:hypothetical protein
MLGYGLKTWWSWHCIPCRNFVVTCKKAHVTYLFAWTFYLIMISCCTWELLNKSFLKFPLRLLPSSWWLIELIKSLIFKFYLSCLKHVWCLDFSPHLHHMLGLLEPCFKMLTLMDNTYKCTQYYNVQLSKWMTHVGTFNFINSKLS